MIGSEEYQQVPKHLQQIDPQYKVHHYSQSKRNPTPFEIIESLINDPTATSVKLFKNVAYGSIFGTASYALMRYFGAGQKNIFLNRAKLSPINFFRLYRVPAAYGAMMGLLWFTIHDALFCTHGSKTPQRELLCFGIEGSVIAATLYNPGAFFYGAIGGVLFGLMLQCMKTKTYPQNVELYLPNFDNEKRERIRRDDIEKELSDKLRITKEQNKLYLI